jgi:hypothetical protein
MFQLAIYRSSLRSCKLPSFDELWLIAEVGSNLYVGWIYLFHNKRVNVG